MSDNPTLPLWKSQRLRTGSGGPGSRGMSLVEMLLVLGIIGILVAITLPAFHGVQVRNRKMLESNDIRQVHQAWTMYSNFNRDAALPGYLDEDVQDKWRVHYEYPVPPDLSQPLNRDIAQTIAAPWTWRLSSYFDHNATILWRYRHIPSTDWPVLAALAREGALSELGMANFDDLADAFAHEPAFGYNAYHVGGWWEMTDISGPGSGEVPRPLLYDATIGAAKSPAQVVSPTIPSIQRQSSLIVFATSSRYDEPPTGPSGGVVQHRRDDQRPGWHAITPPWWDRSDPHWMSPAAFLGSTALRENLVETFPKPEFGGAAFSPFGRYNDRVVVIHADGSIEVTFPAWLTTPMRWIDRASEDMFEFNP